MTNTAGRRAIAGVIAAGITLAAPIGLATTATAQTVPDEVSNTQVEMEKLLGELFPFTYADKTISSDDNNYTKAGLTFTPSINGEVMPTSFNISHAEDDNGNSIVGKFEIDENTGEVKIVEDIGSAENTLFYFIEVTGTYEDGSNNVDRIFVINESIAELGNDDSVPIPADSEFSDVDEEASTKYEFRVETDPETGDKTIVRVPVKESEDIPIEDRKNRIDHATELISDFINGFTERRDAALAEQGLLELFNEREAVKQEALNSAENQDEYKRFDAEKINRLATVLEEYERENGPILPAFEIPHLGLTPGTFNAHNDLVIAGQKVASGTISLVTGPNGINGNINITVA